MITTSKSCSWKFPGESFNSVLNTGLDYSLECNFCLNIVRMRSLWRPKISFPIFLKLTWSFVIQWIKYSFYVTLDSNLLYYHSRLFSIPGWFVPTMSSVCTIWASRSPIWRPSMPTGSSKWFPLQIVNSFFISDRVHFTLFEPESSWLFSRAARWVGWVKAVSTPSRVAPSMKRRPDPPNKARSRRRAWLWSGYDIQ